MSFEHKVLQKAKIGLVLLDQFISEKHAVKIGPIMYLKRYYLMISRRINVEQDIITIEAAYLKLLRYCDNQSML